MYFVRVFLLFFVGPCLHVPYWAFTKEILNFFWLAGIQIKMDAAIQMQLKTILICIGQNILI